MLPIDQKLHRVEARRANINNVFVKSFTVPIASTTFVSTLHGRKGNVNAKTNDYAASQIPATNEGNLQGVVDELRQRTSTFSLTSNESTVITSEDGTASFKVENEGITMETENGRLQLTDTGDFVLFAGSPLEEIFRFNGDVIQPQTDVILHADSFMNAMITDVDLNIGDVVSVSNTTPNRVTLTTVARGTTAIGVANRANVAGTQARIVTGGITAVNCTNAANRGDFMYVNTTDGVATASAVPGAGIFGMAAESAGPGLVRIRVA